LTSRKHHRNSTAEIDRPTITKVPDIGLFLRKRMHNKQIKNVKKNVGFILAFENYLLSIHYHAGLIKSVFLEPFL
jgi:hypothetical protein